MECLLLLPYADDSPPAEAKELHSVQGHVLATETALGELNCTIERLLARTDGESKSVGPRA